ncbi:hypothetical protein ACJJTC_004476 [Scirpophaga incertulas]
MCNYNAISVTGDESSNPDDFLEKLLAEEAEAETSDAAINKIGPLISKLISTLTDLSIGIVEASNEVASKTSKLLVSSVLPPIITAVTEITPKRVVDEAKSTILGIGRLVKLISGAIKKHKDEASISPIASNVTKQKTEESQFTTPTNTKTSELSNKTNTPEKKTSDCVREKYKCGNK